jgi:hypothetical protein
MEDSHKTEYSFLSLRESEYAPVFAKSGDELINGLGIAVGHEPDPHISFED